jgi:ubiquinone/menaquinone biosynthesis C-methylase UbiE
VPRIARVALVIAGVVSGYYLIRLIKEYLGERRQREVFSSDRADDLLNPLRSVLMPARRTLAKFKLAEGQTVLELGPGPGYHTIEASQMVGAEGRVICLDIQRGMIERLLSRVNAGNVRAIVGDATQLPLRDGTIDRAYLVTVLGEIPDPVAALCELRRVFTPAGVLAIDETMRDSDYVRLKAMRRMCADAGFVQIAHHRSALGYTALFRAS